MLCSTCGNTSKGVVCVPCRTERTRRGMLLHQRRFLATWLAGNIDLRLRRKNGVRHLELFDDRWHTYCDLDLFDVEPEPERTRELPADLCEECAAVMQRLIRELGGPNV